MPLPDDLPITVMHQQRACLYEILHAIKLMMPVDYAANCRRELRQGKKTLSIVMPARGGRLHSYTEA
jgi:hypothetical protein